MKQRWGVMAIAVSLWWTPGVPRLVQDRFLVERSVRPDFSVVDTIFIGSDTSTVDLVPDRARRFYRVRTERPRASGEVMVSAWSDPCSALGVDFSEGFADTMQVRRHAGGDRRTLMVAVLPRGQWSVSWAMRMWVIGAPTYEWVEPWCAWDWNRDKLLDLIDLVSMGVYLGEHPEEMAQFRAMYGRWLKFKFVGQW